MIRRREIIAAVSAVAAQERVRALTPGRTYRIGYLGYTAAHNTDDERVLAAFRRRLRELGLDDGGNLVIEWRYGEGRLDRESEMAAGLVRAGVELVVVASGSAARAVMQASAALPVVAVAVPDPVRTGLVASLAHPGGQVTGISNLADDLTPKRLELLKAAVPAATRIAIARCPRCVLAAGESADGLKALYERHAEAARVLGVTLIALDVNDRQDFQAARALLERERPAALLLNATQVNAALRAEWATLATTWHLPAMAPARGWGTLFSYGADVAAIFRLAADYVARILDGARPADLPMQQPTRFEFVVDLRVARAIGVTIPQSLLLRADEVIE
jgi:putative ABC transport system substrate-binding protein